MLKAGIRERVRVGRNRGRHAPVEIQDGIEVWARKHGRHAKLKWLPDPMNCWAVELSYRVGDPRQRDGSKNEQVLLHEFHDQKWWAKHDPKGARRNKHTNRILHGYKSYDLDELGVTGIVRILDKGDLLSGRGRFDSVQDAADQQEKKFRHDKHKRRLDARSDADHRSRDMRRSLFKIPFLPVGIDLTSKTKAS